MSSTCCTDKMIIPQRMVNTFLTGTRGQSKALSSTSLDATLSGGLVHSTVHKHPRSVMLDSRQSLIPIPFAAFMRNLIPIPVEFPRP